MNGDLDGVTIGEGDLGAMVDPLLQDQSDNPKGIIEKGSVHVGAVMIQNE